MSRILRLSLLALMAIALAETLAFGRARAADQPVNAGHVLISTSDFQISMKAQRGTIIFAAYMPARWAYSISVDANHDGMWGYRPEDNDNKTEPKDDFSLGSTDGQVCPQYVYSSYRDNPDIMYASSYCGARTSSATYVAISLPNDRMIETYDIPQTEMSPTNGRIEFVINVWDGKSNSHFGSPLVPLDFTLPAGT